MLNKQWLLPVVVSVALGLGACGSSKTRSDADGSYGQSAPLNEPYTDQITTPSYNDTMTDSSFDTRADAERALTNNLVYFDFDETTIKAEYLGVVENFARYLTANPSARVRLEGHADERGTREYNLGLGERRALSVQSVLQAKGVSSDQISILSYGEERPVDDAHNESAWSQNRRVQIIRQ
ncbi:peptidoglycan-associated lipoprotein Pal [Sinimarinibacterium sp. NLF-5-8]|uniref:peptidoglycan-associated lipoprotein Pal n=1 Tax=Sinimarinibacterium sp. NLF-5-8 TaxID=2698684 RepID=UPI00137C3B61|nr:peptidoglycan-associated lipoprotein Pal [Sinimarinibacterium sp. NLF-5-8]QHS08751.1 peptidoglycan-associated lipoprotein Pal [Sinimarinibacterium sp. NLF-5-8]